ncbi:MAG: hypothetical protein GX956_04805, partial [Firmicutes bacterium]|nr:hypothetical protein [Bacillota bacterium]
YFFGKQKTNKNKLFLIENKLAGPLDRGKKHLPAWDGKRALTIGYFGLLTYTNTWDMLTKLVDSEPNKFQIYVRGFYLGDRQGFRERLRNPHFIYEGPYIHPEDLSGMHSRIDLIWAGYISEDKFKSCNLRWAMRNQFYEACYFNTPLIVQKGTQAEKYVEKFEIGLVVDMSDVNGTISKILGITPENISKWTGNLKRLPESFSVYTDEHERLAKQLGLL